MWIQNEKPITILSVWTERSKRKQKKNCNVIWNVWIYFLLSFDQFVVILFPFVIFIDWLIGYPVCFNRIISSELTDFHFALNSIFVFLSFANAFLFLLLFSSPTFTFGGGHSRCASMCFDHITSVWHAQLLIAICFAMETKIRYAIRVDQTHR